jgi:hypothetical protein
LDVSEFAVCMYLVEQVKEKGATLPQSLPEELIPPDKRAQR